MSTDAEQVVKHAWPLTRTPYIDPGKPGNGLKLELADKARNIKERQRVTDY